jgi:membrane protein implicated in regulation of membrane protease activity
MGIEVDTLVGETAVVLEEMAAGAVGKVELRGSAWRAQNVSSSLLESGQRCRVEKVDGLMLQVRT